MSNVSHWSLAIHIVLLILFQKNLFEMKTQRTVDTKIAISSYLAPAATALAPHTKKHSEELCECVGTVLMLTERVLSDVLV